MESKHSGLVFIGGVYLAPPLLTSLVVVGLAFTFDPSLVVIGSYCGVAFIDGNSEKRGEWWFSIHLWPPTTP